jgi:MFS family permease
MQRDATGDPAADRPTSTTLGVQREHVAFAALRHPEFRQYYVANMLSMMAENVEHAISYWVIFQAFHSPVLGGFAIISHWVPFLFFSVYCGALADRFDCRRIIQSAQVLFMAVSLAWGILSLSGLIQGWHSAVLLVVHGLAGVLSAPASQLIIHEMVGSEHLQSAVRLNSTGRQMTSFFGPAVGGALMLGFGPAVGLLANTLFYLPLSIWLLKTSRTGHGGAPARGARRRGIGLKEALKTVRQISGNRVVLSMILLAGAASLFVGSAFQAQMPEYAHDLGADEHGLGFSALLTANAAGAVIGGLLLESRGLLQARAVTAIVCAMLWCAVMGLFAAATNYLLALALLFCAGVLNLTFNSMAQSLVQLLAPAHLRGQLIGLYSMSHFGLRSFSGVTVGVLGSFIGVHWSLGLSAGALLLVTAALLVWVGTSGAR